MRQLHGAIIPVVPVHEFFQRRWEIPRLLCTASAQLVGHVLRDIPPPALGGIEGDDANRIASWKNSCTGTTAIIAPCSCRVLHSASFICILFLADGLLSVYIFLD